MKINFECKLNQIVEIGDGQAGSGLIVIGSIVLFHIDSDIYQNGHINLEKLNPLGRVAGNKYILSDNTIEIVRKIKPDK